MGHTIAAAIYDGLSAFEYSIACEIFGRDRRNLEEDWYTFLPCRTEPGRLVSSHGLDIRPEGTLADLIAANTILIPGWREPLERPSETLLEALRIAHARKSRLVTICTGAFVLAHAGILDRRRATTHWLHTETLATNFPDVVVDDDALYLHDHSGSGAIFTSAGSAAGLDLCLAVVREDFGITTANAIARRMVAPVHRDGGQSQYTEALARVANDESFGPVLDWMLARLDTPLAIDEVARQFGFSLRTFQRRFNATTGLSPHQWLVGQRIRRARELLESTDRSIERVATDSGLGSAANLRKHLAQQLATTPRAYRSAFRASS